MDCQFCHRKCTTISDIYHGCSYCSVDYHPHVTCLFTHLGDKAYTVNLHKDGPFKITISSAYQDPLMEIVPADNITPQNVQQKLKTYLTFS